MNEMDLLFFFDGKPAALDLFQELRSRMLSEIQDVQIRVQKTQITFSNRYNFAFVSFLPVRRAKERPATYITVSFGLAYQKDSPRIDAAVEVYPHRWTHHMMISSAQEIDRELLDWLREAADFSSLKRPKNLQRC